MIRQLACKAIFLAAPLLVSVTASAQDFGGLLRGVMSGRTNDLIGVIQSVAEVSLGQIGGGAEGPPNAEGKVVLYSTAWCGYCKRAVQHMKENNIAYDERDIERNPGYKAEYSRMGGKGPVPFTVFGNQTLVGFSPAAFDQRYADFRRRYPMAEPAGEPAAQVAPTSPTAPQTMLAEVPPKPGDTLVGKISGIKVLAQPTRKAAPLLTLGKSDEVIYMGEERAGFYLVTSAQGEGWVDKLLVRSVRR